MNKKSENEQTKPTLPEIPRGTFDLIFDIETSPLPEERLLAALPPFDREAVKTGNWPKDEARRAEKWKEAEQEHRAKMMDRAALDPKLAFIMCFGFQVDDGEPQLAIAETIEEEKELIIWIRDLLHWWDKGGGLIIGYNIKSFDLRFILQRCWIQGTRRPRGLVNSSRGRIYWGDKVRDLYEEWLLPRGANSYDSVTSNGLDAVCAAVTGERKIGDGKYFAQTYRENREQALKYAMHDVRMTANLNNALFGSSIVKV